MARRPHTPHRTFSLASSHWRSDGRPKVGYRTQSEALSAADERAEESGVELSAYRCTFCHHWHMGRPGGRHRD